jgi:hypothetical protein
LIGTVVNAIDMVYIRRMETSFPVRKALQFTAEQWERVRAFRFDQKIGTEAEAVRRLIDLGLETAQASKPNDHA